MSKFDGRVARARQQRVPGRVGADLVQQFVQRDEVAGPLAHLHGFTARDRTRRTGTERIPSRPGRIPSAWAAPRTRTTSPWWSAPHTYTRRSKPRANLSTQIGDSPWRSRCAAPVPPDEHPVLVVAEGGRAEPDRSLGLVRVAGFAKELDGLLDAARFLERGLREPRVEMDAEAIERAPDPLDHAAAALVDEPRPARVRSLVHVPIPHLAGDLAGELVDVLALVAVLRDRRLDAEPRQVPGLDRLAQQFHLGAGVVPVVLALDAVPVGL